MPNKPRPENRHREVRVEDELWRESKRACDHLGTTRAEVMRHALRKAVDDAACRCLVGGVGTERTRTECPTHGAVATRSAALIRFHLRARDIGTDDRADLAALADSLDASDDAQMAVWRFARDFARTSGDSPDCSCVNCRAYRAVRDDEGHL